MSLPDTELHADDERRFYVVFTPDACSFWWQRLLKKGFKHCYVIIEDEDQTLMVSHRGFRLDVRHYNVVAQSFAKVQAMGGHKVLEMTHQPVARPQYRTIMTCVSVVMNVIGLRGVVAFTPYQLYRALLSRQAKVVEA